MKDKIFMLVIGILIGAIITASGFLIFNKSMQSQFNGQRPNMENFNPQDMGDFRQKGNKLENFENKNQMPEPSNSEFKQNGDMANPPEMPSNGIQ